MDNSTSKTRDTHALSEQKKRRVYFNEYNVLMDKTAYLPLVSGILKAYALKFSALAENYDFLPFLFHRDDYLKLANQHQDPTIAAFSVSMWNEQLSLKVAQTVKSRFPKCLIVFGGPQVPHHPEEYFRQYPFVDIAVRGEGEEAFAEILMRFLASREFRGIAGVSYRDPITGDCIRDASDRPQSRDLDIYPSPYLEGLFESLMKESCDLDFQAIIETNRGCPFPCTFCFWGQGGLSTQYRFHSLERVRAVIEWCAQNKIKYVFNADSNFGMHPRDREIAQFLVDTKKQYGFPEKFRTCFGKNTDEKIYRIGKLLHDHGLEKGITLARQSNDPETLKNIRRQNIRLSTYKNLQTRFNEDEVPVYTELILGLPGETYGSWVRGIEEILQSGIKNQLFVYMCSIFPNTEMADPEYQKKFQIVTDRIPLNEIHGKIRSVNEILEQEDIIVSTSSMTAADWKRMSVLSWVMQVFHSLKLAFFIMVYLYDRLGVKYTDFIRFISERRMSKASSAILHSEVSEFEDQCERILKGQGRGLIMPEYGPIYWDVEEASFLRISEKLDQFYRELYCVIGEYLNGHGIAWSQEELQEVIAYQRLRIPTQWDTLASREKVFPHNFPEYFENCFKTNPVSLSRSPQILELVDPRDYLGDGPRYARETILWGRKSGTMLRKVRWNSVSQLSVSA